MQDKVNIMKETEKHIQEKGFIIIDKDLKRPWGGFFVIEEKQATQFVSHYFPEENINDLKITEKLSPKILVVAPGQRLSWQYHQRRAEIWKCIGNDVEVITGKNNQETQTHFLKKGEIMRLDQGMRHRLIGLDNWGIIAEIWQHTDADFPSDEEDIIRLQDDYSRK